MPLTAEQETLVAHPETGGPALVVAVAGAGKTTAICATVRRMIALGNSPQDILVATFSKPGCADMRARAASVGVPHGVNWRTLHSCGWSIIGEVSALGKETPKRRDPVIVDPRGKNGWWVKKLLREYLKDRTQGQSAQTKQNIERMSGTVLSEIGLASAHLIWPDAWTAADGTEFPGYHEWATTRDREPADGLVADITDGFYRLWEEVKTEPELRDYDTPKDRRLPRSLHPSLLPTKREARRLVRWFSFDDMIAWPARWILEGKRFVERYQDVFAWVVVDEAQDNNLAQTALAEHLAKDDNLILVGDDQQSIYAFRGSRPALLRIFRDKHVIKQIQFTANFRCAQAILDVGNGILGAAEDRLYDGDLRLGRTDECATAGTVTANEYDDSAHEAASVLDGIVEAIANGVNPDDIAVLYRLNSQSGPFELECIKRGLLYKVAGSKFFDRAEIKTLVSFLACALDDTDEAAWKRVSSSTVRGLGTSFRRDYPTFRDARRAATKRGLLSGWKKALKTLLPIIDKTKAILKSDHDGGLRGAIEFLSDDAGIRKHYRDDAASDEDETDVDVALNGLAECADAIGNVDALLRFASADTGKATEERQPEPRITLSTVHKAKGLEWSYVACIGWTAGVFPFFRAPRDEELRLAYVAATRAKQYLHISWTTVNAKGEPAGPSELVSLSAAETVAEECGEVSWPVALDDAPGSDELPSWGTGIGDLRK